MVAAGTWTRRYARAAGLTVLVFTAACGAPECREICRWTASCSDLAPARGESCRHTCEQASTPQCRSVRKALAACLEAAPKQDANACEKSQKHCNAQFAAYQARCLSLQ
jgi:hypothetical protein